MKSHAKFYGGYIAVTLILIVGVLSGIDTLKAQHVIMKVNGLEEPYYPVARTYMSEAEIYDRIFELAPEFDEMANSRSLGDAIQDVLAMLQRMRAFTPEPRGPIESNINAYADAYAGQYQASSFSNQSSSATGQGHNAHDRGLSNRADEPEGPGHDGAFGTGSRGSYDENNDNIGGRTPSGPQGQSPYMGGSVGGYDQRGISIRGEMPEVPGGPFDGGYSAGGSVGGFENRGISIRGEMPEVPGGPFDGGYSAGGGVGGFENRIVGVRGEMPEVPGGPFDGGYSAGGSVGGYENGIAGIRGEGPEGPCGPGHNGAISDGNSVGSIDERIATVGGTIGASVNFSHASFEGSSASFEASALELHSNEVPRFDPPVSVAALNEEGVAVDRIQNMGLSSSSYWLWYESRDRYADKVIFIAFPVYHNAPYEGFKQVFAPKGKTSILSPFGIPFWANDETSGPWILLVVNDRGNVAAAPLIVN